MIGFKHFFDIINLIIVHAEVIYIPLANLLVTHTTTV